MISETAPAHGARSAGQLLAKMEKAAGSAERVVSHAANCRLDSRAGLCLANLGVLALPLAPPLIIKCVSPSADKPFTLKITDIALRERVRSAYASLNAAMAAGDEARRKAPTLQRRYIIDGPDGERWELAGGQSVVAWHKQ